jgi:hypothetical protein
MNSFSKVLSRASKRSAVEIEDGAERLLNEARAAGKLRAYSRDPDVAALTIERTRENVERIILLAMVGGLAYTTVNVQQFVAAEATGVAAVAAWLVEPAVTVGLLAFLRVEHVAVRNGVTPGPWVRWARWCALGVTYVMNTWASWVHMIPSDIFKHSAIPLLVFAFAEALTDGRVALTKAAEKVGQRVALMKPPEPVVVAEKRLVVKEQIDTTSDTGPIPNVVAFQKGYKGYKRDVLIPQAWRKLAEQAIAEGRSLDTISNSAVDREAGTSKYVTSTMITQIREEFEREVRDGTDG